MTRSFETSHPWLSFNLLQINKAGPKMWLLLGEARSKCEHLAGTPLTRDLARELNERTLIRGALATAAIEGNTLTEKEAVEVAQGRSSNRVSTQYQESELRNVLTSLRQIEKQVADGNAPKLTPALILDFHRTLLQGLEENVAESTVAGKLRNHSVVVGNYRGAPAQDCEYLLGELCKWLDGPNFKSDDPAINFSLTLIQSVIAHLYVAWIHPFGDGNGRTARLVEHFVLARSGKIPLIAAHIMSDHYNKTRDRYYLELDKASKTNDIVPFITYAIEGFVDGIRAVIALIRTQQLALAWETFVHEKMRQFPTGDVRQRQLNLVLAMQSDVSYKRAELEIITGELARQYAKAGERTMTRDLNRLVEIGLVVKEGKNPRWRAQSEQMLAFLPVVAPSSGV